MLSLVSSSERELADVKEQICQPCKQSSERLNFQSPFGSFPRSFNRNIDSLQPSKHGISVSHEKFMVKKTSCTENLGIAHAKSEVQSGTIMTNNLTPLPTRCFRRKNKDHTMFRIFYDRGDIPVSVEHHVSGNKIKWRVQPYLLDYHHFLPLFFDGLRETQDPYRLLAEKGVYDLLCSDGTKVLPVVPQLIMPIKKALNTKDLLVVAKVLKVLQTLVRSGDGIGASLVPYYRQILPSFEFMKSRNLNIGDKIEYSQRRRMNLGDLIEETLEIFEKFGGPNAYMNIKYLVPTYESQVKNFLTHSIKKS